MRMTVSLLRNLDAGALHSRADAIDALSRRLRDRATDIDMQAGSLGEWQGLASEGAKAEFHGLARTIADLADTIARGGGQLRGGASRLRAARRELESALAEAADNDSLRVNDDGTIDYVGPQRDGYDPYNPGSFDPCGDATAGQADRLAGRIQDALLAADRADGDTANELDRISGELRAFVPPGGERIIAAAAEKLPAADARPAAVAKWWHGLDPVQREAMIFLHPEQLGRLDGIPVLARNRANLTLLADQQGKLAGERDAAGRNLEYSRRVDPDGAHTTAAAASFAELDRKLDALRAIEDRIYHPQPGQQPGYLLGVDTGGAGRVLFAAGNPDTASNTVTYVPGTGSGLSTAAGEMQRSDLMIQAADLANGGDSRTAAVTWVGYEAPPDLPHAALNHYADHAEHGLAGFQAGLDATHQPGPSHHVLLGHSYGSTVIGHALRDHPGFASIVDDAVFVGSPGVGVPDVDGLHLAPDQVHATVARHDMIRASNENLPIVGDPLGPDPTGRDFGARVFSSNAGTPGPAFTAHLSTIAHLEYWGKNNSALTNMGRIIVGKGTF